VPQQPINTYSNLAYLAAGILVHFHLKTDPSFVFAVTMTYLAIGSALYHATSTRWAGMLDVTGIYAVFSAIAVYALLTLLFGDWDLTPEVMLVVAGVCATVLYKMGKPKKKEGEPHAPADDPCAEVPAQSAAAAPKRRRSDRMRTVIAICLGTAYLCVLARMAMTTWKHWPLLASSVVLFVLGYWSWGMDRKRTFPLRSWGHGVWHVLTAAASGLVFYAVHYTALPE
jgi:predicted membrane channel-forming protein YqfA (hemolysin III family)